MMITKTLALCIAMAVTFCSAEAAPRNLRAEHEGAGPHTHTPGPAVYSEATQGAPVNTINTAPGVNVNVNPSMISTNVNITPGSSTMSVNGGAMPASAPAPATGAVAQPTSGLSFGNLLGGMNPLTSVATLARVAHGALLGHTGTLPSSFMQNNAGGGHH